MRYFMRTCRFAALAGSCLVASSCGGGGGSSTGALNISLTDAPVDSAAAVVIAFTGVQLHTTAGQTIDIDFATPKMIDLMQYQGGATGALTEGSAVPAGNYDWMRLKVLADMNAQGESYIKMLDNTQYPLWIPSGAETGLKLVRPFTVAQGSTTKLVIDFDLRKSITAPPGLDPNYVMRPALRLIDELQVGKITANIDLAALAKEQLGMTAAITDCKAGLYLFANATATPDDQDGDSTDGADPIVYEPVAYDGVNSMVSITIPFVEVGDYTVAGTCNFDVDAADTNDYDPNAVSGAPGYQTMKWTTVQNVSVTANNTTAVSLPSPTP